MDKIVEYITHHYLDMLPFETKLAIVTEIYNPTYESKVKLENLVVSYFNSRVLEIKNAKGDVTARGIILANEEAWDLYVQNPGNLAEWARRKESDYERFKASIMSRYVIPHSKIPALVGIIHPFRNRGLVFKTRNMQLKRASSGAYCHQSGKLDAIKHINQILEQQIYMENNTKFIFNIGLCVILEILMRHFTEINHNNQNRVYFFDAEKTLINQIVNCKLNEAGDLKCI
jgi:hypothetical protein